jgi:hypothetical protein
VGPHGDDDLEVDPGFVEASFRVGLDSPAPSQQLPDALDRLAELDAATRLDP